MEEHVESLESARLRCYRKTKEILISILCNINHFKLYGEHHRKTAQVGTHPHQVQVVVSVSVGGAGEVVAGLAELDGHLVGRLAAAVAEAVAEHEVRVAPRRLGRLHLERVVVVALVIIRKDVLIKLNKLKRGRSDSPWDGGASCGVPCARPCPAWRGA